MTTETQQRLAECRAAIKSILENGQRVRKADREVQYAELAALRALENTLATEAAAEQARLTRGRNRIRYLSI